ncbi:MAG: peptide-methionine (S)-S-oxide reductase MsrA [Proteobacteria bacterium]|nr:peptide-methionine (S)-S-oxide reductase MsrA [Pseudomonadota bacterium]
MTRILPLALFLFACAPSLSDAKTLAAGPVPEGKAEAVFAGGCFWCMEKPFEKLEGVETVESGYTGGAIEGPTYEQVGGHQTQHIEAIRVVYDPSVTSYDTLLWAFWHNIDPTQGNGQFCDRGHQYTTAVFAGSEEEKAAAEKTKKKVAKQLDATVVTDIRDAATFWLAEDYHQDFYKKSPERYYSYRLGCGRDARLRALWGDKAGH